MLEAKAPDESLTVPEAVEAVGGIDMKNRVLGFASLTLATLLCVALPAFGANTTITFVASTSEYGDPFGSAQTGLYGAVINATSTLMVCDDFNHEITNGETWTANGVNAANLTSVGALQFPGIGLSGYTEVAYLVSQMFVLGNTDSSDKSLISQAIWYITSGGTAGTSNAWSVLAQTFLTTYGVAGLKQFSTLWIYTPTNMNSDGPQEMWGLVPVPEGGAALLYLLLAGVSCFGAMFFRSRNQSANPGIA